MFGDKEILKLVAVGGPFLVVVMPLLVVLFSEFKTIPVDAVACKKK